MKETRNEKEKLQVKYDTMTKYASLKPKSILRNPAEEDDDDEVVPETPEEKKKREDEEKKKADEEKKKAAEEKKKADAEAKKAEAEAKKRGRPKYRFPGMDEPADDVTLKHKIGGPVCGGHADVEHYKYIFKAVEKINFDQTPKGQDEILWFKWQMKKFIKIISSACSEDVTIYTIVAIMINKSVKYLHTVQSMAKKEEHWRSFRHFAKAFMAIQWPNIHQHTLLIARQHYQRANDSVETYYEKHCDVHEETGRPLDDSVEAFIDGLYDKKVRELVRYHDYGGQKTLVDVRNYASKTIQNIKMERARSIEMGSKDNTAMRQILQSNNGSARRANFNYSNNYNNNYNNNKFSRNKNKFNNFNNNNSRQRQNKFNGSANRNQYNNQNKRQNEFQSRTIASYSNMRPRMNNRNKNQNKQVKKPKQVIKQKKPKKMRGSRGSAKISAVSDNRRAKINDAIQESKNIGLPNCIGCGSRQHRYSEYFSECDSQCPFCHKSFKKDDIRHFAIKCNKRPEEKEKCIEMLQAMEKRR